ncbi:RNA methyltransferase [Robiginitalea sp. SC105]|uniref:TrmH family RNA methyltransferase n=1 Tax=Robiginitalea sp. SC105 TaxID=2762332 RepID=UPI001639AC99|nr:RNA methyltransferase [Robiginitalea sp. SC105]MBC2839218.1 RNA methyltransferase [Robiginitalea sp. SC105]
MASEKHISSIQNPEIRQLQHWSQKSRDRRKSGLFVLEGYRELGLALKGGYRIRTLYFCPDILPVEELHQLGGTTGCPLVSLSPEVYRHVAYRGKTEGVIALMEAKSHRLGDLEFRREQPLILVAESPEKPGNLGALLRTADAASLDAVIVADMQGDLYNPNVIRSSVGCLFTVPVATGTTEEVLDFLKKRHIGIFAASLGGAVRYDRADFTGASAIAVGTEATGLTPGWTEQAAACVEIPMGGEIDSMNVSVAAAILIFEACRQRGFAPVVEK